VVGRYDLTAFFSPHARVAVGLTFLDASLTSGADDTTFEDSTVAPFVSFGLGASLLTPRGLLETKQGYLHSLQLGIRGELGYTLASGAGFTLEGDDNLRVPVDETSLGSLSRSGPYIQTALFARF
jgi:hypothetical protein